VGELGMENGNWGKSEKRRKKKRETSLLDHEIGASFWAAFFKLPFGLKTPLLYCGILYLGATLCFALLFWQRRNWRRGNNCVIIRSCSEGGQSSLHLAPNLPQRERVSVCARWKLAKLRHPHQFAEVRHHHLSFGFTKRRPQTNAQRTNAQNAPNLKLRPLNLATRTKRRQLATFKLKLNSAPKGQLTKWAWLIGWRRRRLGWRPPSWWARAGRAAN